MGGFYSPGLSDAIVTVNSESLLDLLIFRNKRDSLKNGIGIGIGMCSKMFLVYFI